MVGGLQCGLVEARIYEGTDLRWPGTNLARRLDATAQNETNEPDISGTYTTTLERNNQPNQRSGSTLGQFMVLVVMMMVLVLMRGF